jgi:hypothetical protein
MNANNKKISVREVVHIVFAIVVKVTLVSSSVGSVRYRARGGRIMKIRKSSIVGAATPRSHCYALCSDTCCRLVYRLHVDAVGWLLNDAEDSSVG